MSAVHHRLLLPIPAIWPATRYRCTSAGHELQGHSARRPMASAVYCRLVRLDGSGAVVALKRHTDLIGGAPNNVAFFIGAIIPDEKCKSVRDVLI